MLSICFDIQVWLTGIDQGFWALIYHIFKHLYFKQFSKLSGGFSQSPVPLTCIESCPLLAASCQYLPCFQTSVARNGRDHLETSNLKIYRCLIASCQICTGLTKACCECDPFNIVFLQIFNRNAIPL